MPKNNYLTNDQDFSTWETTLFDTLKIMTGDPDQKNKDLLSSLWNDPEIGEHIKNSFAQQKAKSSKNNPNEDINPDEVNPPENMPNPEEFYTTMFYYQDERTKNIKARQANSAAKSQSSTVNNSGIKEKKKDQEKTEKKDQKKNGKMKVEGYNEISFEIDKKVWENMKATKTQKEINAFLDHIDEMSKKSQNQKITHLPDNTPLPDMKSIKEVSDDKGIGMVVPNKNAPEKKKKNTVIVTFYRPLSQLDLKEIVEMEEAKEAEEANAKKQGKGNTWEESFLGRFMKKFSGESDKKEDNKTKLDDVVLPNGKSATGANRSKTQEIEHLCTSSLAFKAMFDIMEKNFPKETMDQIRSGEIDIFDCVKLDDKSLNAEEYKNLSPEQKAQKVMETIAEGAPVKKGTIDPETNETKLEDIPKENCQNLDAAKEYIGQYQELKRWKESIKSKEPQVYNELKNAKPEKKAAEDKPEKAAAKDDKDISYDKKKDSGMKTFKDLLEKEKTESKKKVSKDDSTIPKKNKFSMDMYEGKEEKKTPHKTMGKK